MHSARQEDPAFPSTHMVGQFPSRSEAFRASFQEDPREMRFQKFKKLESRDENHQSFALASYDENSKPNRYKQQQQDDNMSESKHILNKLMNKDHKLVIDDDNRKVLQMKIIPETGIIMTADIANSDIQWNNEFREII